MRQETLTIQATDFSEMLTPAGLQCYKPENQKKLVTVLKISELIIKTFISIRKQFHGARVF